MLATESYRLWYNGESEHRILGLAKYGIDSMESKSLAEYFLQKLDYAANPKSAASFALSNQTVSALANPGTDYVRHIHAARKEEIEIRWTRPQLTDEQASEILFADKLEKELEKIAPRVQVNIACGA